MGRPKGSKNKTNKPEATTPTIKVEIKPFEINTGATDPIVISVACNPLNPREEGLLLANAVCKIPPQISDPCIAEIIGKLTTEKDGRVASLAQQLQVAFLTSRTQVQSTT